MKKLILILVGIALGFGLQAQQIDGAWYGELNIQGNKLRLNFNITHGEQGVLTATMDSPDQGAKGIEIDKTSFADSVLSLEIDRINFKFSGKIDPTGQQIIGTFKQGPMVESLTISRKEVVIIPREQEPQKPYPYLSEDVTFPNAQGGNILAGTLTRPKEGSKFPAVVLISGSGAQNRDEELMRHKPFLVLSDFLTRNGIAVLRYDDRGVGGSTGSMQNATTVDLATDARAAFEYLKTRPEINSSMIGLAGHSEGGVIAPMVAAESNDVAFVVMMAGTGIPGDSLMILQQRGILAAMGVDSVMMKKQQEVNRAIFDIIKSTDNDLAIRTTATAIITQTMLSIPQIQSTDPEKIKKSIESQVNTVTTPWIKYFIRYNPAPMLERVKCPVLAINGTRDLQVPCEQNLSAIEAALKRGGNTKTTIERLPNLNHLFQECTTGLMDEYPKIEQTFSPKALKLIADWIVNTSSAGAKN